MEDILCNATIRFAEGSYVTLSYVNGAVEEGDAIGFLVYTDEEGVEHKYPIGLGEEISEDGGED